MKKFFFLPVLFLCSICYSQNITMQIADMPESSSGIEILSFSWGATNSVSAIPIGGGTGSGKVNISSFNFIKVKDKSTPKLIQAVVTGKHIPEVVITLNDASSRPTFRYILKDVIFESIQQSSCADKKCNTLTESISIVANKWKWEDLMNNSNVEYDRVEVKID